MVYLREGVERVAADVLRRRIWRGVLRVRRLKLLQSAQERVIFKVADLGRVFYIVEIVCALQLTAQRQNFFMYVHSHYSTSTYV